MADYMTDRMTTPKTPDISILLVDDHPVVRQGYRRVLENQGDFRVIAEADSATSAYGAFKAHAPDVVVLDVTAPAEAFVSAGIRPDCADIVLMNPPFNDAARHRVSPDEARASAHVAEAETLEGWIHASRRLLKSGGVLTLIWRADGLSEVLAALGRGFGSLAILPVHAAAAKPAIRVLVRAVKGGRAPPQILTSLLLKDESGLPNKEVAKMLAGDAVLPLASP